MRIRLNTILLHWEPLLAHRHWFTIHAFGKKLRLCARCSGVVLGFIFFKSLSTPLFMSFSSIVIPIKTGFILAIIFALPAVVDWMTQVVGLRESTNRLRIITGFLEGIGVLLLSLTDLSSLAKFLIVSIVSVSVVSIGVLIRRLSS
ncbi:hypothetical protein DRO61_01050 [Candidatus Bathyarchaeota archaeon]|nr:MAG: hypothetical protein DRO61_01050 [Candidatus Bathyarchaeota archaeon]